MTLVEMTAYISDTVVDAGLKYWHHTILGDKFDNVNIRSCFLSHCVFERAFERARRYAKVQDFNNKIQVLPFCSEYVLLCFTYTSFVLNRQKVIVNLKSLSSFHFAVITGVSEFYVHVVMNGFV